MKFSTPARITAVVLGSGAAAAIAIPAMAAVSASSPPAGVAIEIVSGKVVARGAQATVTFRVTCPAGSSTYLNGQTSQRVGSGVASGTDAITARCTNVPRLVTLTFPAQSGGRPFREGAAATRVDLQSYVPDKGFVQLRVDGRVRLQAPR